MVRLRPAQEAIDQGVQDAQAAGQRRIIVVAATGIGKTVMWSNQAARAYREGRRAVFVVGRTPLIDQTIEKLGMFGLGPHVGVVQGRHKETRKPILVAMRQTLEDMPGGLNGLLGNRPTDLGIDECHEEAFAKAVRPTLEALPANTRVIGYTGTPGRLSPYEDMGDLFDHMVAGPIPRKLMAEGWLLYPRYRVMEKTIDLSAVKSDAFGEYQQKGLALVTDTEEAIANLYDEWFATMGHLPTLTYCVNRRHAEHVNDHWNARGTRSAVVDQTTTPKQRRSIFDAFRRGWFTHLASVGVLTTGFDAPNVGCINITTATKSWMRLQQIIGRGLRPHRPCIRCRHEVCPSLGWEGVSCGRCGAHQPQGWIDESWQRVCFVNDQTGCTRTLQTPEEIEAYHLRWGSEKTPGTEPKRLCPKCRDLTLAREPACRNCGFSFPPEEVGEPKLEVSLVGKLVEVEHEQKDRRMLEDFWKIAMINGYSPTWPALQFHRVRQVMPSTGLLRHSACRGDPSRREEWLRYIRKVALAMERDETWADYYTQIEWGKSLKVAA